MTEQKDVLAVVISWPGMVDGARALQEQLSPHLQTVVVSSSAKGTHPDWHEIGDAWFTEQMAVVRKLFLESGRPWLFMLMADTTMEGDRYAEFVNTALAFHDEVAPVGFYYPQQDFSLWQFEPHEAEREYQPGVFECPLASPDLLQCLLPRSVMLDCPEWDHRANRLGWGIDHCIVRAVRDADLALVQDKNFQVRHPRSRSYHDRQAWGELKTFIELYSLGPLPHWHYEGEHEVLESGHFEAGARLWDEGRPERALRTLREGQALGCGRCATLLRKLDPSPLRRRVKRARKWAKTRLREMGAAGS